MNWLIGERRKGREIRNANVLDFGDEKKKKLIEKDLDLTWTCSSKLPQHVTLKM